MDCFLVALFFSNEFIAHEAMRAWEGKPTPYASIDKVFDWGIVLTGVVANDRQPTDRVYFQHGADRVMHTIQLYKKGIIKKILISGGTGALVVHNRPEADEIREVMLMTGVQETDILIERDSRNTHESAVATKAMLAKEPGDSYVLITSGFHMYRSIGCFDKAGLERAGTRPTERKPRENGWSPSAPHKPRGLPAGA